MKEFVELTSRLAKEVMKIENSRRELGQFLRRINSEKITIDKDICEERIIIPVERLKLNKIKVAGVDGGLAKRSLHGIDVMLSRAVGVLFSYSNNKLEEVDYYPSPIPTPIPNIIFDPYSELELEISCNMERQILEAAIAKEVIENFKPEILLMHGSIIPHYTEKPSTHSLIYPTYFRLIEVYKKLFQTALGNKILLAGIVEDSRGMRFCEILNNKILPKFNLGKRAEILLEKTKDTNLLSHVLEAGERTTVFSYSSNPTINPVLKDFGEIANLFFSFYLRTVKFDRPIRVDLVAKDIEAANKLPSVLLSLTGHSEYGIPSVLIEADQRVRLTENDLNSFYHELINRIGHFPAMWKLRRERRSF